MRKRRRAPKWPVIVLLAVVGMVVLGWYWTNRQAIHRLAAAIRAKGYPATPSELDAWYVEPPPGENAAEIYEAAFKLKPEPLNEAIRRVLPLAGLAELPPAGERLSIEALAAVELYLLQQREALVLLHEGAKRDRARYSLNLAKGFDARFRHLHDLRYGETLLKLEAIARAEHGDAAGAVDSLVAGLRLAESLADEPTEVSQFCRVAQHALVVDGISQVLCRVPLDSGQRDRLDRELSAVEQRNTLYRGLVGDQAMAVGSVLGESPSVLDLLRDMGPVGGRKETVERLILDLRAWVLNPRDLAWLTESTDLLIQASLATDRSRRNRLLARADRVPPDRYISSTTLYPALRRAVFVMQPKYEAQLANARMALAIEAYRLDHGKLLADANELVPQYLARLPDDPFTNGPLKYVRTGGGYIVYSVGVDGMDSGGMEPARRRDPRKDNLVFRVERPGTEE